MKTFLLASGNSHKAQEFKDLFLGEVEVQPAPRSLEVDETGVTFSENALIKARAYFENYKIASLADDSGLVIESLPDILGVQSARFAPELADYKDKNQKILTMLQGKPLEERKAYFVCVLCFYFSEAEVYFFEGRVHGHIATEIKGSDGFGYDPIFVPDRKEMDGKTLAELPEWKNLHSHRAKAVQGALKFFA